LRGDCMGVTAGDVRCLGGAGTLDKHFLRLGEHGIRSAIICESMSLAVKRRTILFGASAAGDGAVAVGVPTENARADGVTGLCATAGAAGGGATARGGVAGVALSSGSIASAMPAAVWATCCGSTANAAAALAGDNTPAALGSPAGAGARGVDGWDVSAVAIATRWRDLPPRGVPLLPSPPPALLPCE